MVSQRENLIIRFIQSHPRNKIIFFRDDNISIPTVDIGHEMASAIYSLKDEKKLSLKVTSCLDDFFSDSIIAHPVFGKIIAINNLGLLLEPELKLDFNRLLDSYSQNNVLFVKWEGEIDADNIYFLTRENGIKISLKNLSHIVI